MAEGPSVKGAGLQNTWAEVNELIDQQMISREELTLRLDPEALEIIEEKIEPSLWYPIAAVEQLIALVVEFKAGGDMDYLVEMGGKGFRRLLERESFRTFIDGAAKSGARAGPTLMGLTELLFNFGIWRFVGEDLSRFAIEIEDAEVMSELLCWVAVGYAAAIIDEVEGEPSRFRVDRSDPRHIVLTRVE